MGILLEYIGPFFGLASAIITTISFFKENMKHKIPVLVGVLFLSGIAILIWSKEKEKAYDFELLSQQQRYEALIEQEKTRYVVADAKIVASSVDIYGLQSYGKHLANLGTMVSFYHRHEHLYGTQYEKLSKQYDHWESFFRQKREKGESMYSSDYSALEGLVESNYKFVQSIAEPETNT
ncbi:hypothetical protein [Vibrio parahaemolyticus]|uniref:hypothetical protein n=1 Tax=Vibrio parahaemolyticus TaxID=670 RepID=UPI0023609DE3|nr:hypothetical protein [Vibrio parahaemolyticus]